MDQNAESLAAAPLAGLGDAPVPDAIDPALLGTATLEPTGTFEAGSYQSFTLTYRAGVHGIDDSGSLRLCFRFATDQGRPQFDDPKAANYVTVSASNGARLDVRFDYKSNVRPWDRTIYVKVVDGFLSEGDTIVLRLGDRQGGSPGLRLQSFCEERFQFRVLVDPIATFNYQPLPQQPEIALVPGPPQRYVATVPTLWPAGRPFALHFKGEDRWGNPSDRCDLAAGIVLEGGPRQALKGADIVALRPGQRRALLEGLRIEQPGEYRLLLVDQGGRLLCRSNPLRIEIGERRHAWADLHAQSQETIGTNSAEDFFCFARDLAPLDAVGHQGNDFQISGAFWAELDRLTRRYERQGAFVALPGYEWSGNTSLGGDRNVYFPSEGRTLRRSSHALVPDKRDSHTDCRHARDLFAALATAGEWDAIVFAHCGGRYADLYAAHDGRFERSVEIHSSWGTFEWILYDALDQGFRVGIVANSDGHKGRPGACYPGASLFGAIGGLTCLQLDALSRDAVFDCLRRRHHYGTTGGPNGRLLLDVEARFPQGGTLYHDDPAVLPNPGKAASAASMGDIVRLPAGGCTLCVTVSAGAPIERIDLFDGRTLLETVVPFGDRERGRRIRVLWTGARYRGRFRQVVWDGQATLHDNEIETATPINFFNPEKRLVQQGARDLVWQSLTTGNSAGFDLSLRDAERGELELGSGPLSFRLPLAALGAADRVFALPGPLPRQIRVTRLPDSNEVTAFGFARSLVPREQGDSAVYVRVTLEDGTQAWSSPIYLFR